MKISTGFVTRSLQYIGDVRDNKMLGENIEIMHVGEM